VTIAARTSALRLLIEFPLNVTTRTLTAPEMLPPPRHRHLLQKRRYADAQPPPRAERPKFLTRTYSLGQRDAPDIGIVEKLMGV